MKPDNCCMRRIITAIGQKRTLRHRGRSDLATQTITCRTERMPRVNHFLRRDSWAVAQNSARGGCSRLSEE
jgi:hypothetical protein